MNPQREHLPRARSSGAGAGRAGARHAVTSPSTSQQLEQEGGPFIEDVEGDEHDQRRDRICTRRQEVGRYAERQKPVRPVLVEPTRFDDAEHAQDEEDDRELEDDAEPDDHDQHEADELADIWQIAGVGRREGIEDPDVNRQRVHRDADADAKEKDRQGDQRQDEPALVRVQAGTDEPPHLLNYDWRGEDEPDVERDLDLEKDSTRQLQVNGVSNPRPLDEEIDHAG